MHIQFIRPFCCLLSLLFVGSIQTVEAQRRGEHRVSEKQSERRLSEQRSVTVEGDILDINGKGISGVDVYAQRGKFHSETDAKGHYIIPIQVGREGKLVLHYTALTYKTVTKEIVITSDSLYFNNETLASAGKNNLDAVTVAASTPIQSVRESAYNVVAIDAKPYYNSTMDLSQLLDRASGVKVRSSGGVGSGYNISLNGFTGRHVKVFMDGVPMEGMGSAFQLNNIPVNIAERIEVYKGVVPIEFGSDAIGGVINIVTKKGRRTHLDASYSYGSFNTHKSNIDFGMTTKKGFTFNVNAFQNYSDNSYKVWMEQILNLETLGYETRPQWVKRFHDRYHNESLVANVGFVNTKWADKFLVGVTLGQEQKDIQNAFIMKVVYGMRQAKGHTVMPNLSYVKRNLFIKGLNLNVSANYSKNYNKNIDTASRRYNWLGEWAPRTTIGEASSTLAEFNNLNFSTNANLTYHIGTQHTIAVNDVYNHFTRKSEDPAALIADESEMAQYMDRKTKKNIFGVSYKYDYSKRWNTSVFAKSYNITVNGPVNNATALNTYDWAYSSRTNSVWGYGAATTYFLKEYLQLKGSYEKAVRMPTDGELFGDQQLLTENTSLRPERSNNFNIGVVYNKEIKKNHSIYADIDLMYRSVFDYIRAVIDQRYATNGSVNHGKVTNMGINAELKYFYKDMLSLGGTVTYQNLRNKERNASAASDASSATYGDRLPNVPYFFGNTDVTVFLKNIGSVGSTMSITYSTQYVHQFYLYWPGQGQSDTKFTVPDQFSHDVMVNYSMSRGKYNIGLEGHDLTNRKLYDNFSLQKPGRSFSVKLRYYFMQ